jgi:tetratricopeptide (TPR) repeat protein
VLPLSSTRRILGGCLLGVLFLAAIASAACSQDETPSRLERAKKFYMAEEYGKAITELEGALVHPSQYTQDELAAIYLYLGLAYLAFDRRDRAHEAFAESLRLDTHLQVDPTLRSPEVEEVFERARWVVEEENAVEAREETPRVPLGQAIEFPEGPTGKTRWSGVWRSCVFPGWGQIYGNRKKRGYAFLLGEAGALGGALYATVRRDHAYDDYQAAWDEGAGEVERFVPLYDDYQSWRRTRNTLLATAGGIWVFNVLESLLNDPSKARPQLQATRNWQLGGLTVEPDGWAVRLVRAW